MPPAFRNHLVPTACDTPTATAASSLLIPATIADQKRRRSSRLDTGGRPGDSNGARPDRWDRRFRTLIATSNFWVLRQPVESAQYAAGDYRAVLRASGIVPSMSRKGNCWDNAPMESWFHTLKTELVHHTRYNTRNEARRDLFAYIETYYNRQRLHSAFGYRTPEKAELRAA